MNTHKPLRRYVFTAIVAFGFAELITCVGFAAEQRDVKTAPNLRSVATFRLFTEGGVSLDLEPRVAMKSDRVNDLSSQGELIFRIQDDGKGLMIGNAGSVNLIVLKHTSSVQFLEFTKTGNLMVLTVYDDWNGEAGGFYFVYQRQAWMAPFAKAGVYSTYWGYAKPWD